MTDKETKEKIVDAVLHLIGTIGLHKVTVRKIADLAGVNTAAVNYHFGSKEKAVHEALKRMTGDFRETFGVLEDETRPPEERLRLFLLRYADNVAKYPDVLKHYIGQSMQINPAQEDYIHFFKKEGFALIGQTLREASEGTPPEDQVQALVVQMIAGAAFPVLLGPVFEKLTGKSYDHEPYRHDYIQWLMAQYTKGGTVHDP